LERASLTARRQTLRLGDVTFHGTSVEAARQPNQNGFFLALDPTAIPEAGGPPSPHQSGAAQPLTELIMMESLRREDWLTQSLIGMRWD